MADRINLNRLKNINLFSVKEIAKKTAAITLLLSTVACSQATSDFISNNICWLGPLVFFGGAYVVLGIASLFGRGGGGGDSGGHSGPLGSDPD